MNRPRLIRGLRIAWSVWWGILCVLLVVLWVRSYRQMEVFTRNDSNAITTTFGSGDGVAYFFRKDLGATELDWTYLSADLERINTRFGFYIAADETNIRAPYWLIFLPIAALGACTWLWSWNFSLRTLLIATTVIAVVLGLVFYATR